MKDFFAKVASSDSSFTANLAADLVTCAAEEADRASANSLRPFWLSYLNETKSKEIEKVTLEISEIYGSIWINFHKALKAEGCEYWSNLYQSIFESNFNLDQEALKRRLNVPKEIQEQGAAIVANYLEEL